MREGATTGKLLEQFVALIERLSLPEDFDVKPNERVYDEDGNQIAEFDIHIEGKVGTNQLKLLIECRDRPTSGPAPGQWIEQLIGRRARFGFNKVIAVSTTGFSAGAKSAARESGIELRTVEEVDADRLREWLATETLKVSCRKTILEGATLLVGKDEQQDRRDALMEALRVGDPNAPILRSTETGECLTASQGFLAAVQGSSELAGVPGPGRSQRVRLTAQYPDDGSHYVVETSEGGVRIRGIVFSGQISEELEEVPLRNLQYQNESSGEGIAAQASADVELNGRTANFSLNRMADRSTVVAVRGSKSISISAREVPAVDQTDVVTVSLVKSIAGRRREEKTALRQVGLLSLVDSSQISGRNLTALRAKVASSMLRVSK